MTRVGGSAAGSSSAPEQVGEYRLVRPLGRGAMGQVYLAEDTLLDRSVAVKLIAQRRPDEASRRRFIVEARAIARLSHPNVVAVHRVGEIDGRPYLVTELVRGQSLAEVPKPVPFDQAPAIGLGLSRGLAAAHRKGVLHRDIKPANVMLTDEGEVKILDFGLAKLAEVPADARPLDPRAPADEAEARVRESGERSREGEIAGSPLYMAPEVLTGTPASRRSDIYAAGAVLYELCTGMAPRETLSADVSAEVWIAAEIEALLARVPGIDPRFAAVVDRCLARDPARRFATADELGDALAAIAPETGGAAVPEGNPYRGLTAFEAEHRALFFGRAAEGRAVLDRLRADGLVVVTGDSGVGKSSLCRAGVLPLAGDGAIGDGRLWGAVVLVPGRRPVSALAAALAPVLGVEEGALAADAREDPEALARAVRAALGRERGLVVFVDQLEELCTLADPEEAASFAEALARLPATAAGVRVLLAVRGDFFTRVAALPGLGEEMSRGLYLLRPLSAEGVRAAITGPAARKGVGFAPAALVDTLAAAAGTAGGLPVLQFALAELWEARGEGKELTAEALETIGGVEGALARHADQVLFGLGMEARVAARRVLLRLVTAEGTRARRTGEELDAGEAAARVALEALVRGRLVVAGGESGYELAHEALVHRWATLRGWLDEGGSQRALAERVETAAAEWERLGRVQEALWSGKRLEEVRALDGAELSERARGLLEGSRAQARGARRRRFGLALAGPLALGVALGGLRWKIAGHVTTAGAARSEGQARHDEAEEQRKKAYALFDAATGQTAEEVWAKKEVAERVWAEALAAAKEAEARLVKAGQSLEGALALDPGRAAIRGAIGDVTVERLALAKAFHVADRREDLMLRLEAYDPDGSRRKALVAPPVLSLVTVPPGAMVTLERYEDRDGRKVAVRVGELGRTPLPGVRVEDGPGSYRLILKAPGRVEVRYPVLLEAGERFEAEVPLPEVRAVPEGYVYVPEGRFLVGSADPEALRKVLMTCPPLHEVRTEAFLIGRMEVTFGEWIEFLDALPAEERARHTPLVRSRVWGVELSQAGGRPWRLALTLSGVRHEAGAGEPITFTGRSRRATLRWESVPVTGISLEDAEAYFRWLNAIGRVPGARACNEWEWERAARGADARAFPHGDELGADDANFDQTYGRNPMGFGPNEVGSHPASESPFGLLDAAGNAYEVMHSKGAPSEAVMRGGTWYYDSMSAMLPNRWIGERQKRDHLMGVRACGDFVRAR